MTAILSQRAPLTLNFDHTPSKLDDKTEEMKKIFSANIVRIGFPENPRSAKSKDFHLAPLIPGSTSHVYKISIKDGSFALKRCSRPDKAHLFEREIEVLNKLNQKERELGKEYVVRLIDSYSKDLNHLLLLSLYNMDLSSFVEEKKLSLGESWICLRSLLEALQFLKKNEIMHLDIKPENVFLTDSGALRLGDFGYARYYGDNLEEYYCGTPEYISPEFLIDFNCSYQCDIWSLAITIHMVFMRHVLGRDFLESDDIDNYLKEVMCSYPGILSQNYPSALVEKAHLKKWELSEVPEGSPNQMMENLERVFEESEEPDRELFDRFKSLLNEMLQLDPFKRITVEKALEKM